MLVVAPARMPKGSLGVFIHILLDVAIGLSNIPEPMPCIQLIDLSLIFVVSFMTLTGGVVPQVEYYYRSC